MSESVELALAVLHGAHGGEVEPAHFGAGFADVYAGTTTADAVVALTAHATSTRSIDRFAVAQGLVLASRLQTRDGGLDGPLADLAGAVVRAHGDGAHTDDAPERSQHLLDALARLAPGTTLDDEALDPVARAFGDAVSVRQGSGSFAIGGSAAPFVTMLLELATMDLRCRSRTGTVAGREVLLFEIDVCTNVAFDRCSRSIDPRRWPDCSPFFISVVPVGPIATTSTGWTGVVREVVGLQGYQTFTTDLAITYRTEPGLALTSYDLAPERHDDGQVEVDRGFVAVTDEGVHRRMRALKVYRVEGLDTPPSWVCPLWSQQVVLAAWWCP